MAYTVSDLVGAQPIANNSTTRQHPLGTVVRGVDLSYGEGEFIYLLGVASTVIGSVVTYDATTWQTALVADAATHDGRPVAVAMAATVAAEYGWYQLRGLAVVKKTAVTVTPQLGCWVAGTAGRVKFVASAGRGIVGMRTANLTTVTSTTSTVVCLINNPSVESHT